MALPWTRYAVEIELTEDLLGTVPKQKEVYANYIAKKAAEHADRAARRPDRVVPTEDGTGPGWQNGSPINEETTAAVMAEETETVQEVEERGWTGFHSDAEGCFLYDYQLQGFFSEAAGRIKEWGDMKQLKDKFKGNTRIGPRRIRIPTPTSVLERPLRAQTAQGPRVTLARSDVLPAGTRIKFEVIVLNVKGVGINQHTLSDVAEYGELFTGLGQWRSGGFGRFKVVSLEKVAQVKKKVAKKDADEPDEGEHE